MFIGSFLDTGTICAVRNAMRDWWKREFSMTNTVFDTRERESDREKKKPHIYLTQGGNMTNGLKWRCLVFLRKVDSSLSSVEHWMEERFHREIPAARIVFMTHKSAVKLCLFTFGCSINFCFNIVFGAVFDERVGCYERRAFAFVNVHNYGQRFWILLI